MLPYATSGAIFSFSMMVQYYAGVQQAAQQIVVGQPSGTLSASQAIATTSAAGGPQTNNTTNMIVSPSLGLTTPVYASGPQAGSYRINIPSFDPTLTPYNAGSAVQTNTGGIILSNFVAANPNTYLDCQPIVTFYVQTGSYTAGSVMNFTSSSQNAAVCDFTPGYTSYKVLYNANGTWSTTPYASASRVENGALVRFQQAVTLNAEIWNEAGTLVISQGYAANWNAPLVIQNLTNAGALAVHGEYQISPIGGGQRKGYICAELNGTTGTFA